MPTLDDELRDRLRRAAPAPGGADDLGDRIASRRRRHAAQRRASRVALVGLVLVGTIAGVAALDRAFRGGEPVVSQPPVPTPQIGEDGTMTLEGIPYRVCRPMSIAGDFGSGLDTVWLFEEEPEPGGGCESQGPVRIGVGNTNSIAAVSPPLNAQLELRDGFAPWPYTTPDLDGDRIDEIAIGTGGSLTDGYARVILFRLASAGAPGGEQAEIGNVLLDCGPGCDPVPWISIGTFVESLDGAYCDTSEMTGQQALVRWSAGEGVVEGSAWYLEGDTLRLGEQIFSRPDDSGYPAEDGMTELCGSPASWPEDFATYPEQPPGSPSEPTSEGTDLGIGTNVCEASRLGGLDLVPDGTPDVAWTGYLVKDDGTCPDRDPEAQIWIVAVDLTGDRLADAWTEAPLVNCPYIGCEPRGASDLDADGDEELVISTMFTIIDHGYFSVAVADAGYSITPIEVAGPGYPAGNILPGEPLETSTGGDAGYAAWMRCEGYPDAPVLVFADVESVIDGNDPSLWQEVKLQLQDDGRFHVTDMTSLSLPPEDDPGFIRSTEPACGIDFTA